MRRRLLDLHRNLAGGLSVRRTRRHRPEARPETSRQPRPRRKFREPGSGFGSSR